MYPSNIEKINKYRVFILLLSVLFMISACSDNSVSPEEDDEDPEYVQDIDQNSYTMVQIGSQRWMAQNLRTTSYSNGDPIPEIQGQTTWVELTEGGWVRYQHLVSNDFDYGKIYNWAAVSDSRGLCPQGWKVPSDDDWKILERHLGMSAQEADNSATGRGGTQNVGGKMKAITLWDEPNTGATNESGFDAGPGGMRYSENGLFDLVKKKGFWWSSTPSGQDQAFVRELSYENGEISRNLHYRRKGFSVRCLKG